MNKSKIEWCDYTWNPITGCLNGCDYCSRRIATRFSKADLFGNADKIHDLINPKYEDFDCGYDTMGNPIIKDYKVAYPFGFEPTFHRYRLNEPQQLKKPSKIFVCSVADLFGDWVSDEWIQEVFKACEKAPQHHYLFLTKNFLHASKFKFHSNWWIGKTVTNDKNSRLFEGDPWSTDITERANQFLSIEPLQGPIPDLPYYAHEYGFKWVIIGAETGPGAKQRQPKREWIKKIVEDCEFRKVPVFMKNSLKEIWQGNLIQEFPEGLK